MCRLSIIIGRSNSVGRLWRLFAVWTIGRRVWEVSVCRCMVITCSCLMKLSANRVALTRKGCWWWKGRCRRGVFRLFGATTVVL